MSYKIFWIAPRSEACGIGPRRCNSNPHSFHSSSWSSCSLSGTWKSRCRCRACAQRSGNSLHAESGERGIQYIRNRKKKQQHQVCHKDKCCPENNAARNIQSWDLDCYILFLSSDVAAERWMRWLHPVLPPSPQPPKKRPSFHSQGHLGLSLDCNLSLLPHQPW